MLQDEREAKGCGKYSEWWAIVKHQSHSGGPSEGIERWPISFGMSDREPPGGSGWWGYRIKFRTLTAGMIGGKNADDFPSETNDP